ncbi:methyltransferase domain-containing protein [Streptomyces sp. NPDC091272]|uniref:methyltransferase domain-containing protein n=1 Tax=Streptomyces sp. NPDC091272 TaxID=3365981 RepID=UPI0037F6F7B2
MTVLREKGVLVGDWQEVVAAVRREDFLPAVIETPERVVSRAQEPEAWLAAVYEDQSLVTQVNDGRQAAERAGAYRLPTSSSSMPSLMLEMLGLLDVRDRHRVLELGAGTGYHAAWLACRVGGERVTSVEKDPGLAAQAAKNVAAAGFTPQVVCGDGDAGWPLAAPYDRVIATYAVPAVPYAWVEQSVMPGGRIVAPWGGSFFPHSFVTLDVVAGAGGGPVARGRFSGYPAFMRSRNRRPERGYLADFLHHRGEEDESRTRLSPRELCADADALFWVGLGLTDAWYLLVDAADGSGEATLWVLADDRTSWAAVEYAPEQEAYAVGQFGPRRLWDEVEEAHREWGRLGRPGRDRAGLSVTSGGEYVWLDSPARVVRIAPR